MKDERLKWENGAFRRGDFNFLECRSVDISSVVMGIWILGSGWEGFRYLGDRVACLRVRFLVAWILLLVS
jgi:hypothetical protein